MYENRFGLGALKRISIILGNYYTGSRIVELFHETGFTDFVINGTKWREIYDKLKKIQSKQNGDQYILKLIEQFCNPEEFFSNAENYIKIVEDINEVLSSYGMLLDAKIGKVVISNKDRTNLRSSESEDSKLFDLRKFRSEIVKNGRQLFIEGHYFHSVSECCKAFDKDVAEKSKINKRGFELMSAALSLNGTLKLNKQETETEKNEQEGLMHLCFGLMKGIRNPTGHETEIDRKMPREDALDILSLISWLYRSIDKCFYYKK